MNQQTADGSALAFKTATSGQIGEVRKMANEKRLIDADVLRQTIESKIYWGGVGLLEAIDDAPTVDAEEVVRCKDCKHCTVTADGMICECALPTKRMMDYYIYGSTVLAKVGAEDFCSHGERRAENE